MIGPDCLNCGAPLGGEYCAACGQRAVDPVAPTWDIVREAVSDATDVDGRVLRTLRALVVPGRITLEFLRGRRVPYVGPLKLFLFAGAALSTTWVVTRSTDVSFYGYDSAQSAAGYIQRVVRGSLVGSLVVALGNWVLGARRRRLLDEAVFAVHLVAALSLFTAAVIWLGTVWKLAWGTHDRVPAAIPALPFILFIPAALAGFAYIAIAMQRVQGGAWWLTILRALAVTVIGVAAVTGVTLFRW